MLWLALLATPFLVRAYLPYAPITQLNALWREKPKETINDTLEVLPPPEHDTQDLYLFTYTKSLEYGVSYHELVTTITCESGWDPYVRGDGGHSRGVAQIHAPSHPTITDEQAFDPYWSIEWMAQQFADDKEEMWTCWNIHFSNAL